VADRRIRAHVRAMTGRALGRGVLALVLIVLALIAIAS
jgi:hypothetical protein